MWAELCLFDHDFQLILFILKKIWLLNFIVINKDDYQIP